MKRVDLLVRTDKGFIKIEIAGDNITTSRAADEDIPERIKNSAAGNGGKKLHPFLVAEVKQLGTRIKTSLVYPLDVFVIKRGSTETWTEIETDFL